MADKDVDMTDTVEEKKTTEDLLRMSMDSVFEEEKEETRTAGEERALVVAQLKGNITLCEKTANTKEVRFVLRSLRRTTSLRKRITKEILTDFVTSYFPDNADQKQNLLNFLAEIQNLDDLEMLDVRKGEDAKESLLPEQVTCIIPEVEVYLSLIVLIFLIDHRRFELAVDCANSLTQTLKKDTYNLRTLDPLRAKVYFYYSRSYELCKKLGDIRGDLLATYRTASLRHDPVTQATVLNLLLRNYLEYNLYDQADKLVSNISESREISSSSNQHARYLYYTGRIKAIQLEYTDAEKHLSEALRKAPQSSALGFRKTIQKLLCIVQLLTGEIPEISVFRQSGLKVALEPYFKLTWAVRVGDLVAFQEAVKTHRQVFIADKNLTLIHRLRRNVIKTGLRKINVAYSRITLKDICEKLHLESVQDTEFIVAKAIKDRVIDATIDHENGFLKSRETSDIYSTQEPLEAFHGRINFCLDIHNDAVMAMRYPAKTRKETEQERKDRLRIEQELNEEFEEDDEDDLLDF
eukprot:CAMPEP_0117035960 /NCGR_PEP_ID=MMETSP0472-20121206/25506_1 /TAXON_ID=693140 ORGANISM="Tiarina fusus, Strain LIS" /NCGR_SAMPLE_ID=MMETSP0472 /ASSEMBLY_ACC=CAM_ASM_000603 /LENGTH=521 /DNA_ID=CAMNT_0004745583 /DNA_START=14 /DNA_END=1579 /DNA_ORIENTATION=-